VRFDRKRAREIMEAEYIVQFPKQQQAAVRADRRTIEFQANTAVETEPVITNSLAPVG
jgi:hypothetical protein